MAVCMLTIQVSSPAVHSSCHQELGMEPVLIESPDEVLLKELCYMATGIHNLHVGPGGGTFTLGCSDATLEVPRGALERETSVHYAIILHGPFVFSIGYKPGSVVVYVNMDGATLFFRIQLMCDSKEWNKVCVTCLSVCVCDVWVGVVYVHTYAHWVFVYITVCLYMYCVNA